MYLNLVILAFLSLQGVLVVNAKEDPRLKRIKEFQVESWLTFQMGSWSVTGDVIYTTDVTLQCLPDNRYLLSVRGYGENLPVAKRYMTKMKADDIRMTAISYLQTAIKETTGGTTDRSASMSLRIAVPGSNRKVLWNLFTGDNKKEERFDYGRTKYIGSNFSPETNTWELYQGFLTQLRDQVEPDDSDNPVNALENPKNQKDD